MRENKVQKKYICLERRNNEGKKTKKCRMNNEKRKKIQMLGGTREKNEREKKKTMKYLLNPLV